MVTLDHDNYSFTVYKNDSHGSFTNSSTTTFSDLNSINIGMADLDNDGDNDLVVSGNLNGLFQIYEYKNNGNGAFTFYPSGATGPDKVHQVQNPIVSDLDNDGDIDLLYSCVNGPYGGGVYHLLILFT